MSISFIAAGSTPTGATPSTIAYPAGIQQGDLLLAWVTFKPSGVMTTPSGWFRLIDAVTGTGSSVNGGAAKVCVFWKVASGNESGSLGANPTSDSCATNGMLCYRKASNKWWDLAATSNEADDALPITMATDPGVQTGDYAVAILGNPRGNGTYTGQGITQTGITYGTVNERYEHNNTNSPAMSTCAWDAEATAGTSSAAPTISGSAPANTHTGIFVRLREVDSPFAGHDGYAEATVTNPTADMAGFMFYVSLNQMPSAWWSAAKSDGSDIRASDENNVPLPLDLIYWTNNGDGTGSGLVAVMRPDTYTSGTQKIRLWSGDASLSLPAATDVYGQYNVYNPLLAAFYPAGIGDDRSRAALNLTLVGSPTVGGQSGPINGSKSTELDGSTQYGYATSGIPVHSSFSTMAYLNSDDISAYKVVVGLGATADATHYLLVRQTNTGTIQITNAAGASGAQSTTAGAISTGQWNQVGGKNTSSNRQAELNGVLATTQTTARTPTVDNMSVGAWHTTSVYQVVDGKLAFVEVWNLSGLAAERFAYRKEMLDDPDQSDFYGTWTWVDGSSPATVPTPHYYRRQGALL